MPRLTEEDDDEEEEDEVEEGFDPLVIERGMFYRLTLKSNRPHYFCFIYAEGLVDDVKNVSRTDIMM